MTAPKIEVAQPQPGGLEPPKKKKRRKPEKVGVDGIHFREFGHVSKKHGCLHDVVDRSACRDDNCNDVLKDAPRLILNRFALDKLSG